MDKQKKWIICKKLENIPKNWNISKKFENLRIFVYLRKIHIFLIFLVYLQQNRKFTTHL